MHASYKLLQLQCKLFQGMELQVDFEGRNPQDPDFHGIKTLLQQLFLKAHVDLTGLTELIIYQNYVGSVIKQSENVDEAEDDDDDDDDVNDVFGITTVINISNALVRSQYIIIKLKKKY